MKKTVNFLLAALTAMTILPSCSIDDSKPSYGWRNPNMLVTIKTSEKGVMYFQLDENTTLLPVNLNPSTYKTPVRALANCEIVDRPADPFDKAVDVRWIEPVLTKAAVASEGSAAANDEKYGRDPIEIADTWVSIVEDGYLTVNFVAYFGMYGPTHYVNLLTGVDPEDPYTVELRHDAKGDIEFCERRNGVAAFDLSSLPDTKGETVKLTVKYKGFTKDKAVTFDYCTGHDVKPETAASPAYDSGLSLK